MRKSDLEAFLQRDWQSVQKLKEEYWAERKRSLTPAEALAIGDRLRRHVLSSKPGWPSAAERREDLAIHTKVSAALRRVQLRPGS